MFTLLHFILKVFIANLPKVANQEVQLKKGLFDFSNLYLIVLGMAHFVKNLFVKSKCLKILDHFITIDFDCFFWKAFLPVVSKPQGLCGWGGAEVLGDERKAWGVFRC